MQAATKEVFAHYASKLQPLPSKESSLLHHASHVLPLEIFRNGKHTSRTHIYRSLLSAILPFYITLYLACVACQQVAKTKGHEPSYARPSDIGCFLFVHLINLPVIINASNLLWLPLPLKYASQIVQLLCMRAARAVASLRRKHLCQSDILQPNFKSRFLSGPCTEYRSGVTLKGSSKIKLRGTSCLPIYIAVG